MQERARGRRRKNHEEDATEENMTQALYPTPKGTKCTTFLAWAAYVVKVGTHLVWHDDIAKLWKRVRHSAQHNSVLLSLEVPSQRLKQHLRLHAQQRCQLPGHVENHKYSET